jgi:hypothetical protein
MGRSQSIIIAGVIVVVAVARLGAVAQASIPVANSVVNSAPKAAATPSVTASTPQFSCPNCGTAASTINLNTTLGMFSQITAASLNLGAGIFHPQNLAFPTPGATTLDATPMQNDPDLQKKWQEAAMTSATFTSEMVNDSGDVDSGKLGDYFVAQGIISQDYADHYFGEDAQKATVLKTKSSSAIFSTSLSGADGDDDDS